MESTTSRRDTGPAVTRDVAVRAEDGVRVSVDHYAGAGREAACLVCPGFFQSKDTRTFRDLCLALSRTVDIVAMDFRGHGRSGGLCTFSAREGRDLEAVLAWAEERYARLGLLGFSLGAATAIVTAARLAGRVRSLIAVSAPASFDDIEFQWWTPRAWRTGLRGSEPGAGCRPGNPWMRKARPIDEVKRLKCPALFVHGTRDAIVGLEHTRRLYAAAPEPKGLSVIEGGDHAEALFRDDPGGFLAISEPWIARTLAVKAGES